MLVVLLLGLTIAYTGFAGVFLPFGASLVLCFLVWIVGARLVHLRFSQA
jgi:hypothetical protein